MTLNTLDNGQLAPGDTLEHQIQTNSQTRAVAVKALATNTGIVWVGAKEKGSVAKGWPLAAGEQITLDLKGSSFYYTTGTSGDKLAWMTLGS